jgi:hypothetical protein
MADIIGKKANDMPDIIGKKINDVADIIGTTSIPDTIGKNHCQTSLVNKNNGRTHYDTLSSCCSIIYMTSLKYPMLSIISQSDLAGNIIIYHQIMIQAS